MGGAATLEYLTQFLVTFYCGLSGSNALLGMQAASAYSLSVVLPVGAVVEAGCVHVGEHFEKKNIFYRAYGKTIILFSAGYAGFCALLLNLFPNFFASYATQIMGFIFSTLAITMAWQQQNKTPSHVFTKAFQSLNGYCNAFWDGDRSEAPVELSRVDVPNAALPTGLSAV